MCGLSLVHEKPLTDKQPDDDLHEILGLSVGTTGVFIRRALIFADSDVRTCALFCEQTEEWTKKEQNELRH